MQSLPLRSHAKNVIRSCVPRRIRNWLRSPTASARWAWDEVKFSSGIKKVVQMRLGAHCQEVAILTNQKDNNSPIFGVKTHLFNSGMRRGLFS